MQVWVARAVVALGALTAFGPAVANGLVPSWDDGRFLVDFAPVRSPSWESFVAIVGAPHFEAYHPLHLLSYWLDVPWVGAGGPAIHATSLALWVFALWLLLEVFRKLELPLWPAVVGTLLVGVHPIQVEAVTWATGRKEILALAFCCAAILAHLASERWNDRAAWLARLFYVLAALSKTTALPLVLLLFAIDVLLRDVSWREALRRQLPSLLVGAALGALVYGIWTDAEMVRESGTSPSLVAATFTHHLKTALFPASLSPVYAIHRGGELPAWGYLGPAAVVIALVLAVRARRRRYAFGLAAFTLFLLPVLNLVPLYYQVQDRYLSLPLVGLGFTAAAVLTAIGERSVAHRRGSLALAALLVFALGARTIQYGAAWSSDLRLWGHAVSVEPRAFYAWLNRGHALRDAGQPSAAVAAYDHAIDAAPELRLGYAGRFTGLALLDERDHGARGPDAIALGERFMRDADDADALRLLAGNLAERGYRRTVTMALARSLELEPITDERLERAASIQASRGNLWLARFYLSRMTRPPIDPRLGSLAE